jgi:pimeloyl-ACP methyl ester carboxylesterase
MSRSGKQSSLFLLSILVAALLLLGGGSIIALADEPCTNCAGTYNAWVQADAEYDQMQDSTTYQNYVAAATKYIYCLNQGCFTGGDPDSEAEPDPCLRGLQECQWIWGGNERCLEKCVERYLACSAAYAEYGILDARYEECLDCLTRCDVPEALYPGTKEEYGAFKARCDADYQSLCEGSPQHLLEQVIAVRNRYVTLSSDTTCTASEVAVLDSDGDGVPDDVDACPGTSLGAVVDAIGCPQQLQLSVLPINEIYAPGDAVAVQGSVTDARGNAILGVALYIELRSAYSSPVTETMSDGTNYSAYLQLPRDMLEDVYNIKVTASKTGYPPVSQTTRVQVGLLLDMEVEGNYTGVAADGISELRFIATFPEEAIDTRVYCESDELGATFEEIVAESPCVRTDNSQPGRVEIVFKPREQIKKPHTVRVHVDVEMPDGQLGTVYKEVQVVRTPVVLIHGIWSNRGSMQPLQRALIRSGQYGPGRVMIADYGYGSRSSNQDLRLSARYLSEKVGWLMEFSELERIKVSRVDIVAHSMGGLIARYYMRYGYMDAEGKRHTTGQEDAVRKLITLDTPHGGSSVADWYVEFMRFRIVVCGEDWTRFDRHRVTEHELEWFLQYVRREESLEADALAFGEAVRQMQTAGRAGSIIDDLGVNSSGTIYYMIAGNVPLLSAGKAVITPTVVMRAYPYSSASNADPGDCGESRDTERTAVRDMISEFVEKVSEAGTDGVVTVASQRAYGSIRIGGTATVPADHFTVTESPAALGIVMRYLTDGSVMISDTTGTTLLSESPGHLHVYDEEGRHVGIDSNGQPDIGISGAHYVPFSDMTGEHEYIWVPGTDGIRVEFVANDEGAVGLDISQGLDDGWHWFSYESVSVASGTRISIQLHPTAPTGQVVHSDGTTETLEPAYSEIPEGGGENHSPTASFALMPEDPEVGDPIVIVSTSSDPDGDSLIHTWYVNGEYEISAGDLSEWTWSSPAEGEYTIGLVVMDGEGGIDEYSKTVTVVRGEWLSNHPPTASFALMPQEPEAGDTIVVASTSSDPDGDRLTTAWYLNGEQLLERNNQSDWEWEDVEAGDYTLTLKIDDGRGGSDEYSTAVTVAEDDEDARSDSSNQSNMLYFLLLLIPAAALVLIVGRRVRRK